MRRALAAGALVALTFAGCSLGDGDGSEEEAAETTRRVETTRVEVVENLGEDGSFDPAQIYERLSPGVVTVISQFPGGGSLLDDDGEGGLGSGFVIDDEGRIATNAHVVTTGDGDRIRRAEQVYVEFGDGNRVPAEIVGHDPNSDVALLEVDPGGLSLTPLRLGSSRGLTVGAPVAAIGSPFGERRSLSIGVISAVDRDIRSLTDFSIGNAIQTDAAINQGNSGGPLLNAEGDVIGINAQIRTASGGGEGVGFAIPADVVRRSLGELREKGRVDYGFLGVTTQALYPQLAEHLDVATRDGALVVEVVDGAPADDAGIEPGDGRTSFQGQDEIPRGGDVIVAVDGTALRGQDNLADLISLHGPGDEVELEVVRGDDRRTVTVELGRRPRRTAE
ncbi:MAG: trypsin-like peptidase domain-containing protein [Thermoleophilaceae bacterium]